MNKLFVLILLSQLLTACWGYESVGSEATGQVKM